ncbi:cache domain-containing sensor histidine kinase [Gorillibacterium timonense]|uniref:cache domain-containing sensor histidine kinase n=1 Tax=Gorillibacterium timonense TaxID=1689269 RepID=UPI00071CFAAA|nr:sensor histidine kinase [Gorillibacterium timonense]
MNKLRRNLKNLRMEQKLIIAFSVFIVVPLLIIGGILTGIYMENNRQTVMDAAVEKNQQIIKNMDTSMQPLLRMSMLPVQDDSLFRIMRKEYDKVAYPLLERARDFDTVNGIIRSSMIPYSDLIDSLAIYHNAEQRIIGRNHTEYLNYSYLKEGFTQEPFVQAISESNGGYVPIGVHLEKLLSRKPQPVVSIGRGIIDPYSKKKLGFVLINIKAEQLQTLWSSSSFTKNTRFYLVDEKGNIIYSKRAEEIGDAASAVLGVSFDLLPANGRNDKGGNLTVSSASGITGWRAVTVIPKEELLSIVYETVTIIVISLLVLLMISIFTSARIAKAVMKPLAELNSKMKLVSQGNLDVSFETQNGEMGKISNTIDHMLKEIRSLIQRIYKEEREKMELEMTALQSQIRPHFMYNTLNVVKWMAKIQGATGIEEALNAFISVVKFTARKAGDYVAISEELDFLENYTKILDFRYLNKFEVTFDADPEVRSCKTLKFLLQPLIENAVFHGFDGIEYKGVLIVSIQKEDDQLVMRVKDNGRGIADSMPAASGTIPLPDHMTSIGLSNIRKRLELHFGQEGGLTLERAEGGGTVATVRVPLLYDEGETGGTEGANSDRG